MTNGDEKVCDKVRDQLVGTSVFESETEIKNATKFTVKFRADRAGIVVYNSGRIVVEGADSGLRNFCSAIKKGLEEESRVPVELERFLQDRQEPSSDADVRSACKQKLESLEHWLRRLIDDTLTPIYGDYFAFGDPDGNRLINNRIRQQVETRRARESTRYHRNIDAVLLEDAVDIICNPGLFNQHFRAALQKAFPEGRAEARTFLLRLLPPRHRLAHANGISTRQAEQVMCYSNDVIDSLKAHYQALGMQQAYNVPLILKVIDSFGNVFTRSQFSPCHDGGITLNFQDEPNMCLRPGDTLTVEVEIDPSFDSNSYGLCWTSTKSWSSVPGVGPKAVIPITNKQVGQQFDVQCRLTSNKDWHRMQMGADDFLLLNYRVLPPLE